MFYFRGRKARHIPFYFQILFSNTTEVELLRNSFNEPIVPKMLPGKITETKSRTSFQPNYLRRAIFFTNFLFRVLHNQVFPTGSIKSECNRPDLLLHVLTVCECCCFRSISSLLKSIGLKNQNSQNSNTFVALN